MCYSKIITAKTKKLSKNKCQHVNVYTWVAIVLELLVLNKAQNSIFIFALSQCNAASKSARSFEKNVSGSTIQLGAIMEGETPFLVHSIQGF